MKEAPGDKRSSGSINPEVARETLQGRRQA